MTALETTENAVENGDKVAKEHIAKPDGKVFEKAETILDETDSSTEKRDKDHSEITKKVVVNTVDPYKR